MWLPDLSQHKGARYQALADAIAADVRSGRLAPGTRLPPQRVVAAKLGLNLTTVTRGYALAAEMGVVVGEVGRGTYVRRLPDPGRVPWPPVQQPTHIDLSSNFPFPTAAGADLSRCLDGLDREEFGRELLRYEPRGAHPAHQAAGRLWLQQLRLDTPAERLLITAGAIHAVFVSLLTLTRPGDRVLIEELSSPALIGACNVLGLRAEGLPLDADGVKPEALETQLQKERARAIVLVPTLQNPMLCVMPLERRQRVADIARRHGAMIIEDDAYGALIEPERRLPPIAALAPERVCYATSLSKAVAPGLRLGFLAVPPSLHATALSSLRVSTWMTSPLLAHVAASWIRDGTAEALATKQRETAARRQALAAEILAGYEMRAHRNALHLWLRLPEPWRAEEFTAHVRDRGVAVLASNSMAVDAGLRPAAVRVSLCNVENEAHLVAGLQTLQRVLRGLE